jgi:septal ring factor EnvC (AmiA/AmiB activator)
MARTRSIASIESEIQKTEAELSALSQKYEQTAERLKALQKQKQDYENHQILEAFRKSSRSLDELLIFLGE